MSLAAKLQAAGIKDPVPRKSPVWAGPCNPGPEGGITQSLFSRFLCCRERSRLKLVEGLAPQETFNQRIEYGNMWHVCEEAYAKWGNNTKNQAGVEVGPSWKYALDAYTRKLGAKYPMQGEQVMHWVSICALQFPVYVDWWKKHPEVTKRQRVLEEVPFRVPILLPSCRTVYLRGKWDSVDWTPKEGYSLQENKSKGDVDEGEMTRNLTFDLQTGIYLVALEQSIWRFRSGKPCIQPDFASDTLIELPTKKWTGANRIRYNVIRRPLAGGRHSIRQKKPSKANPQGQSLEEFYEELQGLIEGAIEEDGSHYFFMRWQVDILPGEIEKFKQQFLYPALEQLCDWWEWIVKCWENNCDPFGECLGELNRVHFRYPYGVYNVTLEGGHSEVDEFLLSGSTIGLRSVETLFPELEIVCP